MPERPFRTTLRTADADQLRSLSAAAGRSSDPYRSYEEERALILFYVDQKTVAPSQLVSRWIFHPDERVRFELLDHYHVTHTWFHRANSETWSRPREDQKEAFFKQIIAEIRQEGVYWTPLIDAATCVDWNAFLASVIEAEGVLSSWVEEHATQDDIREMLRVFHVPLIVKAILTNARCIDQAFAREIFEQPTTYRSLQIPTIIAENPHLSSDTIAAITQWLSKDWSAILRGQRAIIEAPWVCLAALLRHHPTKIPHETLRKVYSLPKQFGLALPDCTDLNSVARAHGNKGFFSYRAAVFGFVYLTHQIIEDHVPAPPDVLHALIPFASRNKEYLLKLLNHPNADASIIRVIFDLHKTKEVEICAARHPELRWDPEIRQQLLHSHHFEVLAILAEDADPQTAAQLIRRLIACGAVKLATQALSARSSDQPITLSMKDIVSLLQHSDPNVRLVAMTALDQLGIVPAQKEISAPTDPKPKRH